MNKKILSIVTVALLLCLSAVKTYALEPDLLAGLEVHGFISQGFLKSSVYNYLSNDSKDGSFQFNEMGINFSKQVNDKLRIGVQLFARDLGDAANDKVTLDWAYADYRWKDWLGLRIGKIKLPRGLYNEIRDMDMLRGPIVLPQGIYDDLLRDTLISIKGGSAYGYVPLGSLGSIEYQALIGTMDMDRESGDGKVMNSEMGGMATISGDVQVETVYAGSLRWNTPLEGLTLKTTGLQIEENFSLIYDPMLPGIGGTTDKIYAKINELIFSAEYIWKNLSLTAEYMAKEQKNESQMSATNTKKSESYYLMASYRFTKWLEAGSYYSVSYPDKSDRDGSNLSLSGSPIGHGAWQKDAALFVRFDVNEHCTVKLEGHQVDGTAHVLAVDNGTRSEKNWNYFAAKVTFSF